MEKSEVLDNNFSALIIEDELNARVLLKSMLNTITSEIKIIGEAEGVSDSVSKIHDLKPDVLFLDIELVDGTAFDLLNQIPNFNGQIIFITAYGDYAIDAFKFCAVDYLLKPCRVEDLKGAITKLKPNLENKDALFAQLKYLLSNFNVKKEKRKIAITTKESIRFIEVIEIVSCEADGNYTWIHLTNGEKLLSTKILKEYQNLLHDSGFFRIHHQYLINLNYVKEFLKKGSGYVIMTNGDKLEISRRKKADFLEVISLYQQT